MMQSFYFMLFFLLVTLCMSHKEFIGKKEASQFLRRTKRGFSEFFEEFKQGNDERECVEEVCDYEEVREVFENDQQTAEYWLQLTNRCNSVRRECSVNGTFECQNFYNGHRCLCNLGYVGRRCETKVHVDRVHVCDFYPNLCLNNGTCVDDEEDTYYCNCPPQWAGIDCSRDYDECEDDVCVHGRCINTIGGFRCDCNDGYQGNLCEIEQS